MSIFRDGFTLKYFGLHPVSAAQICPFSMQIQKIRALAIAFPESDPWGLILPADVPLAESDVVRIDDLVGLLLFSSAQCWKGAFK